MSSMQLVERVFAMLRVIAASSSGATLTETARQTRLPKSTVSRIFSTLEALNVVERVADSGGFTIGKGIVALVAQMPHAANLVAVAHPYLQELNETLGETVALALPAGDNAYVVDQINSDHAIQVRDWTGVQIPMYLQSTGRVFLAARSDLALERYLSAPRMAYATKSAAPQKKLRAALALVRAQGFAWVAEEFEQGLTAVAAPVRNPTGKVVAAVNAFGPSFRFPARGRQQLAAQAVVATAEKIAARLQQMAHG